MAKQTSFGLRDKVEWAEDVPFDVIEEHGEGPFDVVGLRLLDDEELAEQPDAHPVMVTIRLPNGRCRNLSGGWLTTVEATA